MSEERYAEVWLAAVMAARLRDRAKVTGYGLSRFADWDTGRNCYPSDPTLAALVGATRKTVKRGRDDLEAAGWIVRTGVGRPRNVTDYALMIPASRDKVVPTEAETSRDKGVPTEAETSRDKGVPTDVTSRDKVVPTELRQLGQLRTSVGTAEVVSRDKVVPQPPHLLTTLREGGGEGGALTAPAPDGAALTRPSVAEVRDLVVSIVPAVAVGTGVDAGNEDLAVALATLLDNGWTADMLRVTLADMSAPNRSATGQLLGRLKALATIDPSALILPADPAPTTSTADPLAEQDQQLVRLFCKWSGADRRALSEALAGLIGQGFALEYLLRAEHPDITVYDPTMGADAWCVSWTTNASGDPEENYSDIHAILDGPTDCLTEQERQAWMAVTGDPRSFSPSGTRSTHERATVADFRRIVTGTHPIARGAYLRSGEPDSVPSTEPKPKGKPTYTPPDVADVLAHDTRTPGPKGFSMAQSPAHDGPGRPYRGPGFDQAARAADDLERQRQQAALQALAAGATAGNTPPEPPRCTRCRSTFGMADDQALCANCRRDDYRRSTQQPKGNDE